MSGTIKVFGWSVMLDKLSSKVKLENRRVRVFCNLCPLCKGGRNYLSFIYTCKVVHQLWFKCDNWIGITSVRHNDSHFCSFYINSLNKKTICVWKKM